MPKNSIYLKQSSFTELLNKNNSVSIHIRNIQRFAVEMFRFYIGLSPPLINNIFKVRAENPYSLRHFSEISRLIVKSVYHGIENNSYLGPKIWNILPENIRTLNT